MVILRLRFPGGRYHATPWGNHVNEGQIEWPPSPWRLLRALIACGFMTQGWNDVPQVARRLLEKLAGTLPSYRIAPASAAHSRHFMPICSLDKEGLEKTTLVFDTWANVGDEPVEIHWDCDLAADQLELFQQLADSLSYLGRSESWVEGEVVETEKTGNGCNVFPLQEGNQPGPQWEQFSLLAPITPDNYNNLKITMERENVIVTYPEDLLDCLMKDTLWWKQHRWSQPLGSQQVIYWRPSNALEVGVPVRSTRRDADRVAMILLALTTPSGNKSALPPCRRTLPQAELLHRAIVGRVSKGCRVVCPELTGRDEQGKPLREGHRHAHILPVDLDNDGHLDHIIVYAPMGLSEMAQQAIRTLRRTWTKGGVGELQVAIAGIGDLETLRSLPPPLDRVIARMLGSESGSRIWRSVTPFVPPRFIKRHGTNSLIGQVDSELSSRGLPCVEGLEILPWNSERLDLRHFVRCRGRGGGPPPVDVGYALQLRFVQPIVGPLTLGYASHFGMGLFEAIDK